jgi:hypothetical protein
MNGIGQRSRAAIPLLQKVCLIVLILAVMVGVESVLLMLASGQLFNSITIPVISNLDFLWLLIKNTPWQGLLELAGQPLLVLGHEQILTENYTVALFFYPAGALLHLLLAWLIVRYLFSNTHKKGTRAGMKGFVIGLLLLLLTLPNIWLASCCGDVPGWPLDVALRQYVFAVGGDAIARLALYENLLPFLFPLQLIIGATGFGLVWRRALS